MESEPKRYRRVLTIAGSDSGGGAGIQADLKTFSALNCYGLSVVTALTAQNTQGVQEVRLSSSRFIGVQLRSVLEDIGADAVKIGMLYDGASIQAVAKELKVRRIPIVLDPVMVAKGGRPLLKLEALDTLKRFFPYVTLLTPNLPEATLLAGYPVRTCREMEMTARHLLGKGLNAVLMKGGHLESPHERGSDFFCIHDPQDPQGFQGQWLKGEWIDTKNTHGTGCTYSSAIAAYLAHGLPLLDAIKKAKAYLQQAIREGAAYELGQGRGPVHHFHHLDHFFNPDKPGSYKAATSRRTPKSGYAHG